MVSPAIKQWRETVRRHPTPADVDRLVQATLAGMDRPDACDYTHAMRCVITAGPTYERLDEVRRLTNFSTGRLGTELAAHLQERGHHVTLLIGEQATWPGERRADRVHSFSTTEDLLAQLTTLAGGGVDAVFHAAAVSDFTFGRVLERTAGGELKEVREGKASTRQGTLLAELLPTPKLIGRLRALFPQATLVGWKFEVDGDRESVLAKARAQLTDNGTTACVANGRAYGAGFGLVTRDGNCRHVADKTELFGALDQLLAGQG